MELKALLAAPEVELTKGLRIHYMELKVKEPVKIYTATQVKEGIHYMELKDFVFHIFHLAHVYESITWS
jgi:hypothetical protein